MKKKKKAFIFDIDGTVADSEMRHLYLENIARGDWSWFTNRIPHFEPIKASVDMLLSLKKLKYKIIFVTVRGEKDREKTIEWLKRYNLYDDELYMRPDESKTLKDYEEKEIHLVNLLERYDIAGAVDDNAQCLLMFRKYGISTFHFVKANTHADYTNQLIDIDTEE